MARLLLRRATSVDSARNKNEAIAELVDILLPDDAPATPAQEPDWRDEVVSWGTGWEKDDQEKPFLAARRRFGAYWVTVHKDGSWHIDGQVLFGPTFGPDGNNAPLARCIAIDKFLADLGVGA